MQKVKVAIFGTGKMANIMAEAMQKNEKFEVVAIASRSKEKACEFAKKFRLKKAYASYKDALSNEEISLVYIATPHAFHFENAKECLLAGKNVLCEKSLTVNAKQAERLFSLAKEKNLFLCEAMWTRFLPATTTVQKLLKDGIIGKPKFLSASISYNCMNIERMTNPNLAGGALLDCGIYALTSAVLLFGEEISDINTTAVLSQEGVDLHSTTILTYKDEKTATLLIAMDGCFENKILVSGDKGYLEINVPFNWQKIKIHTSDGQTIAVDLPLQTANGYEYMLDAVCTSVLNGQTYCEQASPDKTMFILKLMDTLREKWGMKYPFE